MKAVKIFLIALFLSITCYVHAGQYTTNYNYYIPAVADRDWISYLSNDIISMDTVTNIMSRDIIIMQDGIANVKDYGAKGDGSTNDLTAFQNAIASGKTVYIPTPDSFYYIDGTGSARLNMTTSGQTIFGGGHISFDNGAILCTANANPTTWSTTSGVYLDNITLDGLYITGAGEDTDNTPIIMVGVNNLTIKNCHVSNFGKVGSLDHYRGILTYFLKNSTIHDNYVYGVSGGGIQPWFPTGRVTIANNHVEYTGDDGCNPFWDEVTFDTSFNDDATVIIQGNTFKYNGAAGGQAIVVSTPNTPQKIRVVIDGNTIVSQDRNGIELIYDSNSAAPTVNGEAEIIISNNYINGVGKDTTPAVNKRCGISALRGFKSITAIGNTIISADGCGIRLVGGGGYISYDNVVIMGNIISGDAQGGINLSYTKQASVIGNLVYNSGGDGITITGSGINCIGNKVYHAADDGFYINFDGYKISGDVCVMGNQSESSGGDGYEIGIYNSSTIENIIFTGNRELLSTAYGINFSGTDATVEKSIFTNNIFNKASGNTAKIGQSCYNFGNIGGLSNILSADAISCDINTLVVNAPGFTDKVAIGTNTPGNTLSVRGTVSIDSGAGTDRFKILSSDSSTTLIVDKNNRVGFGTSTPLTTIEVAGQISIDAMRFDTQTSSPDTTTLRGPILVASKDPAGTTTLNFYTGSAWKKVTLE